MKMSTTLCFLIPIGALAIAWSFCFVGCVLNTHGEGQTTYTDNFVLTEPSLVAYWPLGDFLGPSDRPDTLVKGETRPAGDLSGHNHVGTYTVPPDYPSAQFSKPIAGSTLTRKMSIVPGDDGSTKNPFPASVDFEGGFVSIPWNTPTSTPADLTDFTLEAWIMPNVHGADQTAGFRWVVFSALGNNNTGFVIFLDEFNNWNVTLGNGATFQPVNPAVPADLTSGHLTYLALTFESTKNALNLWINPNSGTSSPPPANFTTTAFNYAPVDQSQQVTFFIGAGANNDAQNMRTQDGGPGAPLVPFQGEIQSVALYNTALDGSDLQSHFLAGAG
jgi:hypothetical protein